MYHLKQTEALLHIVNDVLCDVVLPYFNARLSLCNDHTAENIPSTTSMLSAWKILNEEIRCTVARIFVWSSQAVKAVLWAIVYIKTFKKSQVLGVMSFEEANGVQLCCLQKLQVAILYLTDNPYQMRNLEQVTLALPGLSKLRYLELNFDSDLYVDAGTQIRCRVHLLSLTYLWNSVETYSVILPWKFLCSGKLLNMLTEFLERCSLVPCWYSFFNVIVAERKHCLAFIAMNQDNGSR